MNEKWFALGIPQIEKKLKTNAASGLSRKAARSRVRREDGSLFLLPKKPLPWIIGELVSDIVLIILLLAALISLFFDELLTGVPVLVLTVGNLLIMGYGYYRSQRLTETLAYWFTPTVNVVRGGKLFCIHFRSLAVGDVILAEAGDVLCCDARIVTSDHLRVRMRVDRENFISLEKHSDGYINPKENRAQEMSNMLHAGSVIEQGSARAIVTAVGKYTYLGAMTGGIPYPTDRKLPDALKTLRKLCARVNMVMLLAVLPFMLISLVASLISGGSVWLPIAFLTAIAIAATTMSQMTCLLLRIFYTKQMRRMLSASNPAVVRSVRSLDTLEHADYLFVMDGSALSDGVLHFHAAACGEGEIRNMQSLGATARFFFDLVSLYHSAATGSLSMGISGSGSYLNGLREAIRRSGVDEGALKIRCTIGSYAPANLMKAEEVLCLADNGRPIYLRVSCDPRAIDRCETVMLGGVAQRLSAEGRAQLEQVRQKYEASHHPPMIFSVCFDTLSAENCFIGMIGLKEGVDPDLSRHLDRLEWMGCRVISFLSKDTSVPRIPDEMLRAGVFSKQDFLKRQLPLTHHFGKIRAYADFDREDILSLIDYVHEQGKTVLTVGFTEDCLSVAKQSDAFITCAPVHDPEMGDGEEELASLEVPGRQYSTSCTQFVKGQAQVWIPRPMHGRGGLASLSTLLLRVKMMYAGLSSFLRYWVWMQMIRILLTALPMLLGQTMLDARHILFCSCVMDAFAFWLFSTDRNVSLKDIRVTYLTVKDPKQYICMDRPMLWGSVTACVSCFALPFLLSMTGWSDPFLYRTEYFFSALVVLHLGVLATVWCGTSAKEWRRTYRRLPLMAGLFAVMVLFLLCASWENFGILLGWEKNPLPYFLISLVPAVVFVAVTLWQSGRNCRSKV